MGGGGLLPLFLTYLRGEPLGAVMPLCSPGCAPVPLWLGPGSTGHGPLDIVVGPSKVSCHALEVSRSCSLPSRASALCDSCDPPLELWSLLGWCVFLPGFVTTPCWSVLVP